MAEKRRHRVPGSMIRRHLVDAVLVWLRFARETGFYAEEIVNEALERLRKE